MKALKTVNATESTALAIAKAAENANASYLATLETHLRISNQESSARKQEQKSNEIINHLKRNLLQKNLPGSHAKDSMASPERQNPSRIKNIKNRTKHQLVDVTVEEEDKPNTGERTAHSNRKKTKHTNGQPEGHTRRPPQRV
jgi:hypothetical protein